MRIEIILFLIVCFLSGDIDGQDSINERVLFLGITPLNLIEPITNTIELVGEYKVNLKYSFEVKFGVPFFKRYKHNTWRNEGKYYEIKLGAKRVISWRPKWHKQREHNYVGLELFQLNHIFSRFND